MGVAARAAPSPHVFAALTARAAAPHGDAACIEQGPAMRSATHSCMRRYLAWADRVAFSLPAKELRNATALRAVMAAQG
eukprot:gene24372-32539_t